MAGDELKFKLMVCLLLNLENGKDKSRVTFGIILFGSADIVVLTHTLNFNHPYWIIKNPIINK